MPISLSIPRPSSLSAASHDAGHHLSRRSSARYHSTPAVEPAQPSHKRAWHHASFRRQHSKPSPEDSLHFRVAMLDPPRESSPAALGAADSRSNGVFSAHVMQHRPPSPPPPAQVYRRSHAALSSLNASSDPLRSSEPPAAHESPASHKASSASDHSANGNFPPATQHQQLQQEYESPGHKTHRKSFRFKHRPSMIDLSKLFPRPRDTAPPMLSPHRLTASPSPVSFLSESSHSKLNRLDRLLSGNRLTKVPRAKDAAEIYQKKRRDHEDWARSHHVETPDFYQQQQLLQAEPLVGPTLSQRRKYDGWRDPTKYRHKAGPDWFDGPAGQVSDDDNESATGGVEAQDTVPAMLAALQEATRPKHGSLGSMSRSKKASRLSRNSSRSVQASSNGSTIKPSSTVQDPASRSAYRGSAMLEESLAEWELNHGPTFYGNGINSGNKTVDISKKNSRLSLNVANLNEASVLCLSSSEDEADDDGEDATSSYVNRSVLRDSIITFDENTEICTAQAVETRLRRPPKRVPASHPVQNRATRSAAPSSYDRSTTSSVRSFNLSQSGSLRHSRYIPSISEPPNSPLPSTPNREKPFPTSRPPSGRQQTGSSINRRSRYIAVTRQEEHLLETIRRNKGSIPPSLALDGNYEREGRHTRPSSMYATDVSFLKLSRSETPRKVLKFNADTGTFSDVGSRAVSDAGDLATDSGNSPRTSLVHSDNFPSPSTGLVSPLTPTLPPPPHCLSPGKPVRHARFPRAALQDDMPRSRSRTGSGSAIVFDSEAAAGKDADSEDLPIWALGWNSSDTSSVAVVV
ncbi:hypothetical protein LOZ36_003859 [Ophidiomyces ophidiicola]|nr:hypothetical protein LOZ36_003859 [Ophidiomyces ophidiicola]